MTDRAHEVFEGLMMKAVDRVITDAEQQTLNTHLLSCEECQHELLDYQQIKETTDHMTQRILSDARREPFRLTTPSRAWLSISYALLFFGALSLLSFVGWQLWMDSELPPLVKVGVTTLALGGLFLFLYALRVRTKGHDPYTKVDL